MTGLEAWMEQARSSFTALKMLSDHMRAADERQQETNEHLESIARGLENLNEQMERLVEAAEKASLPRTAGAVVAEWVVLAIGVVMAANWWGVKLPW